jgi:uncharacterized protein (DUF362 family)
MTNAHNAVVVSLSVKNMVPGAPLHNAPGETPRWNDKAMFHSGVRQINYNILTTARRLLPNWGVALIDGSEGMEGNRPTSGTPVPSRIAIASTDFIAADRVASVVVLKQTSRSACHRNLVASRKLTPQIRPALPWLERAWL